MDLLERLPKAGLAIGKHFDPVEFRAFSQASRVLKEVNVCRLRRLATDPDVVFAVRSTQSDGSSLCVAPAGGNFLH